MIKTNGLLIAGSGPVPTFICWQVHGTVSAVPVVGFSTKDSRGVGGGGYPKHPNTDELSESQQQQLRDAVKHRWENGF